MANDESVAFHSWISIIHGWKGFPWMKGTFHGIIPYISSPLIYHQWVNHSWMAYSIHRRQPHSWIVGTIYHHHHHHHQHRYRYYHQAPRYQHPSTITSLSSDYQYYNYIKGLRYKLRVENKAWSQTIAPK